MKFRVGDKVKILRSDYGVMAGFNPGTIHEVKALYMNAVELQSPNFGTLCVFLPEEVELVSKTKSTANIAFKLTLPTDSTERKEYPLFRGCLRYFPAALAGVARTSKLGNDKHNPGEEMHHAREKSVDHGDCILRHLADTEDMLASLERGESKFTHQDALNEVNQMAWRALAFSQLVHEKFGAPLAPGAKINADNGKGK